MFLVAAAVRGWKPGDLHAQVPLALPSVEAPAQEPDRRVKGKYRRPDLSVPLFREADLPLSAGERGELVHQLAVLARNFPEDRRVGLDWRARALGLALRLDPKNWDCVVANGQLARGVEPLPLEPDQPVRLETVTIHFLNSAMALLKHQQPAARTLGIYLLALAFHLDASNREVFELFAGKAPPVDWKRLQQNSGDGIDYANEELADLRLTQAGAQVLLHSDGKEGPAAIRLGATARKLSDAPDQPLQLLLPEPVRKALETDLPPLRSLLRGRFDAWPAGWSIELSPVAVEQPKQAGVLLGIGLLLEAMVSGEAVDETTLTACGLDPATGNTTRAHDLETLLRCTHCAGPEQVIIISGGRDEEIADYMVLHPERLADLARLTLCESRNFSECVALSLAVRPTALQHSLDQFVRVAERIRKGGMPVLRSPETVKDLDAVLQLNANLVSARYLRLVAGKKQPTTLSTGGSFRMLNHLGAAILHAPGDPAQIGPWKKRLEATPFAMAKGRIDRMRPLLHPNARAYADALVDLGRIYDAYLHNPPQTPQFKGVILKSIREARRRMMAAAPR